MINVLSALPGSGKTTAIFQHMKENKHNKYLYISPFLSEVGDWDKEEDEFLPGRIQKEFPELDFKSPAVSKGTKLNGIIRLLENGENIAATHSLFYHFTPDVLSLLKRNEYVLVIDEALSTVELTDEWKQTDIAVLREAGCISVDDSGKLLWNYFKFPKPPAKYQSFFNLVDLGCLYIYKDKILIWEFPPTIFTELDNVYILTYMFEGSIMSRWCEMNNLKYQYLSNSEWGLRDEQELKGQLRSNLILLELSDSMKELDKTRNTYSATWWEKTDTTTINKIKNSLEHCVRIHGDGQNTVFWTCFADIKHELSGRRYSRGSKDSPTPWLAFNTRATNNYADRTICLYTVNLFMNPVLKQYISSKGVTSNEDTQALSDIIQFIFRGAIRQNKPMKLLILSSRMRSLLETWLSQ